MRSLINKTFLTATLILVMLSSIQCSLENPVAPNWEVDVNIPLINQYTYLNDFLPVSKIIGKSDSIIAFSLNNVKIIGFPKRVDLSQLDLQIESGTIKYILGNHLPFGIDSGMIYISDDSATVFSSPKIVIGPLTVLPALVDSGGIVTGMSTNLVSFALDSAQIALINGGTVFAGYTMVSCGTNGLMVKAGYSDYLHSNVLVTVRKKVM